MQFLEVLDKGPKRSTTLGIGRSIQEKQFTTPFKLSTVSIDYIDKFHDCLSIREVERLGHVARVDEGRTECVLLVSSMFPA